MVDLKATLRVALDGRYAIEGEVGHGAMAVVYRARDLKHDRPVAIKVLKPDLAGAISEERFHREIEVAAGLAHPHIMPLHDSGIAGGLLYFTMPLLEGESLRAALDRREGPLPVAEAVQIACEIAEALDYSHQHGVIHRDVKPGNIMLAGGHALLSDFGIAHMLEEDHHLTQTGAAVGTALYMSPEQAGGEGPIDGRSDVYSLGCVLFEMLTGSPPFAPTTRQAVIASHLIGGVPSVRERRPDAPQPVSDAVVRAMSKLPKERFATAEAFAKALKGEPGDGKRKEPTGAQRLGGAHRKRLRTVAAIAAGALFLAAVGPVVWNLVIRPPEAYSVEDPRGSYVIVPSARAGQTPAEEALVVKLSDWFAFRLGGFESVRVVQDMDMSGPWDDLGIEGATLSRLEDGLRLAQALRVGTLVTVTVRIVGDSAYTESREYDAGEGYELDRVQAHARLGELDALAAPFIGKILEFRGEKPDPGQLLSLSRNLVAHQEFQEGLIALHSWRLEEAEQRFRESIAQDSSFALPHHYLAMTLYWQTTRRPDLLSEVGAEAARLSERAVRLAVASDLPPGHVASINAFAAFWAADYESARSQYDAILAADSTNSEAWLLRGAVEFEDRSAQPAADGVLTPRSNLNLARRSFEMSVQLARDQQLSYGLLFEIDREVLTAAAGLSCPLFHGPDDPPIPPWQVADAAGQPSFCPYMKDSLVWVPYDDLTDAALAGAQAGAARLYRETLRSIQRWADFAPDQPRPREEWSKWLLWRRNELGCDADPAELADVTRRALANKQIELEIRGDTTPADRVRLANLLWVSGDPAAATEQLDRAVLEAGASASEGPRELPPEAANLYLATGRPSRALDIVVTAESGLNFSYPDPRDDSFVSSGEVEPAFSTLRVLGSVGMVGPRLTSAFEDLDRRWSEADFTDRDRAVLHLATLTWLGPALLLDPEKQRAWLDGIEDNEIPLPPVWQGLRAVDADPPEALRALEEAADSIAANRFPRTSNLYLVGMLAQRADQHERAVEHFERLERCPASLGRMGFGWGLQALSRLQRARSLEALGRSSESAGAFRAFAEAWSVPDPELENTVAEARAAADRLE